MAGDCGEVCMGKPCQAGCGQGREIAGALRVSRRTGKKGFVKSSPTFETPWPRTMAPRRPARPGAWCGPAARAQPTDGTMGMCQKRPGRGTWQRRDAGIAPSLRNPWNDDGECGVAGRMAGRPSLCESAAWADSSLEGSGRRRETRQGAQVDGPARSSGRCRSGLMASVAPRRKEMLRKPHPPDPGRRNARAASPWRPACFPSATAPGPGAARLRRPRQAATAASKAASGGVEPPSRGGPVGRRN